ncbi:hypothetical protein FRC08_001687 [Ceratobasidium sp. 394]|nr:hypothetical protein FRC08_001687 [Ceratobasidium sp. 394]
MSSDPNDETMLKQIDDIVRQDKGSTFSQATLDRIAAACGCPPFRSASVNVYIDNKTSNPAMQFANVSAPGLSKEFKPDGASFVGDDYATCVSYESPNDLVGRRPYTVTFRPQANYFWVVIGSPGARIVRFVSRRWSGNGLIQKGEGQWLDV